MVLEKTLESPLDCNHSILKEISPGCLLEGLMLKLKLQYFGHLMRRADSFEKTLVLGKIEAGDGDDSAGDTGGNKRSISSVQSLSCVRLFATS